MSRTYTETVILQEVTCDGCGITFAFPQKLLEGFMRTGKSFYCPNGHSLSYSETEGTCLRKQLAAEQEQIKQLKTELLRVQDQLEASERELRRHKKRIAHGVCPCCHRSFVQLQRHMKTQHPEYGKDKLVP